MNSRSERIILYIGATVAALILLTWAAIVGFVGFAGIYAVFHRH